MVFMGSKNRYSKYIVPILQQEIERIAADTYIEPFCGGCSIIDKIKCKNRYAYDRSETLIALLRQAAEDFSAIPPDGTRAMWDEGKAYVKDGTPLKTMSLVDVGAIEFLSSFSCRGFPGGYAKNTAERNYYKERLKNLEAQAPNLKGIIFKAQNYWDLEPDIKNAVIYCDIPYQNTKQYGYANQTKMDYDYFWNWVRDLSKNNSVFVSEQNAPSDFEILWEKDVKRTNGLSNNYKATERLYKLKK